MQNRTVLVLLRPIFGEKLKIAPPSKNSPPQTFEFPILAEKSVSKSVKTFFFFLRSPEFVRKKRLNFRFWPKNQSQNRWRPFFFFEITWIWAEKRLKFRDFREMLPWCSKKPCDTDLHFSHSFKIAPPFSKSWLRAWLQPPSPPPGYATAFHFQSTPKFFHFILKFFSIFHSILPYLGKFRPEATRNLYCIFATLSMPLQVVACKRK